MQALFAYVRDSLAGAWMVMLGRREGLDRLDLTIDGFWRSFGAIAFVVPFALLASLSQRRLAAEAGETAAAAGGGFGFEALALAVDWLTFPIVFAALARPLGLGPRYVPFIVARNWSAAVVTGLVSVIHAGHLVGLLPAGIVPFLLIAAVAVALRFAYMVAATALAVTARLAIPIVVLDFLLSLTIWTLLGRFA
jgi:hypothetical protein